MPWVKTDDCTGCEICVSTCPVDAIFMEDERAKIDMGKCIRCGECHDICPQDAVRHDSEKIPEEVEQNIEWVRDLMTYYHTEEERKGFLQRIDKHFNKERRVIEETMKRLETFKNG